MDIGELLNEIENVILESENCIRKVLRADFPNDAVYSRIRELVIIQSFMQVYIAWESYLEQSFIYYTMGGTSLSGRSLPCYISPRDELHADLLIKGTSQYPDWSSHNVVIKLAENIFEDGEPYKTTLQMASSKFKDMKKVRNAISHKSIKSKEDFDTLVRNSLSPGKVGISVSEYLTSAKGSQKMFYKIHFGFILNSAKFIANGALKG